MLKKVLVVALLGLSSTAFAGGFQIKVGASLIGLCCTNRRKVELF